MVEVLVSDEVVCLMNEERVLGGKFMMDGIRVRIFVWL